MAVVTTPCPDRLHTPAQPFPDRLALDGPVSPACLGPIVGQAEQVEAPLPPTDGSRLGGLLNAINAVFAGCMVRRKRAHRFGKTAITRRASASSSQPMMQSSAQRVRKHRPCIRGCTSLTNHASKTRCRNTFDTMGEITPPCGVPLSGEVNAPDSSTPAWSHCAESSHYSPIIDPLLDTLPQMAPVQMCRNIH